jgi:Na+-translocating ferredoxin:NAD+ oxidoreductase RNF subunit RnfB
VTIQDILNPVFAIGAMGLLFGVGLGFAAKKFAVPVDERAEAVRENLPGANCGGCGCAGCDAFAKAVSSGQAKVNGCPVCTTAQVEAIAKIMGVAAEKGVRKVAQLRCAGKDTVTQAKYAYSGVADCNEAHWVHGGPKGCKYGCLGLGSCEKVCEFDAITMKDGIAVINKDNCVACGCCIPVCPRNIIHFIDETTTYHVNCCSTDKGKDVRAVCEVGCIGCMLCVKQCPVDAIGFANNLAWIDEKICIGCGKCEEKCPTHAITNLA